MNVDMIFRVQDVSRWHTINMSRRQSVAEHSFNVAVLVLKICNDLQFPERDKIRLVGLALLHDIDEVYTGDAPSTSKDYSGLDGDSLIIKVCDLIDALHFSSEFAVGSHSISVVGFISDQLAECLQYTPGLLQESVSNILGEIGWMVHGGKVVRRY